MELQKGIPIANRASEELIEVVDNCCLCGTKLAFYHITDFKKNQVLEEGKCGACGVKSKVHEFVLQ
ncbi:MAG: hypothetical protein AB7F59_08790 [Bdellovibrionales bacterium]